MSIDADEIARLAKLACLEVRDPAELQQHVRSLQDMLELSGKMHQVDTRNIMPLSHPLDVGQKLRPDEVSEGDQRDACQSGAPQLHQGFYLVPRVIE